MFNVTIEALNGIFEHKYHKLIYIHPRIKNNTKPEMYGTNIAAPINKDGILDCPKEI